MLLSVVAMLHVAATPADFEFILFEGPDGAVQTLAPAVAVAAPNARASSLENAHFRACRDTYSDQRTRCIRARLPEGRPILALAVDSQTVSNVTGSVRFQRHSIRCIGNRNTGQIRLDAEVARERPEALGARLRECIAAALAEPGDWGGGLTRGLWSFPIREDRLASDGSQARGWAAERAIAEVDAAVTTHRSTGQCSLSATIVHVESGRRLRSGDRFAVAAPCQWDGADRASRMFTQGFTPGNSMRVYVRYEDGVVAHLEAL